MVLLVLVSACSGSSSSSESDSAPTSADAPTVTSTSAPTSTTGKGSEPPEWVRQQGATDLVSAKIDGDDAWYSPANSMLYVEDCDVARAATAEQGQPWSGFGFFCPS